MRSKERGAATGGNKSFEAQRMQLESEHGSVSGALLPHVSAAECICAEMPPCNALLRQTLLKEEGLLCANGQKSKGWICILLRHLMIIIENDLGERGDVEVAAFILILEQTPDALT